MFNDVQCTRRFVSSFWEGFSWFSRWHRSALENDKNGSSEQENCGLFFLQVGLVPVLYAVCICLAPTGESLSTAFSAFTPLHFLHDMG
jgi:hypothetical protein